MPQHKYPMQETTNAMIASITYSFLIRKSATINLIIAEFHPTINQVVGFLLF